MKTVSFDIPENLYHSFKALIKLLPEKIKVYAEDIDNLTIKEEEEVYKLKMKTRDDNFEDFDDWDEIKETI